MVLIIRESLRYTGGFFWVTSCVDKDLLPHLSEISFKHQTFRNVQNIFTDFHFSTSSRLSNVLHLSCILGIIQHSLKHSCCGEFYSSMFSLDGGDNVHRSPKCSLKLDQREYRIYKDTCHTMPPQC